MELSVDQLRWMRSAIVWLVVLVVVCLALTLALRTRWRGLRWRWAARRSGLRWLGHRDDILRDCPDLACLHASETGRALNCVEGERGGRAFVVFDYHFALPGHGAQARAHMGMALIGWVNWYLLPVIDSTRDPGYSAAVVACRLPPGARTLEFKRALRPWVAEFGQAASVIRPEEGYRSLTDLLAATDRLNAALDEMVAAAPRSSSPAA